MSKFLEHLRACAQRSKEFSGNLAASVTQAAADAIEEVISTKADKAVVGSLTIAGPWNNTDKDGVGTPEGYPYYCDVSVANVTENDRATVVIAPDSADNVTECGLCPTNQTLSGVIRLWAKSKPAFNINVNYWIEKE